VPLSSSLTVNDPDNANLASATVKISAGTFANDGDLLAAITSGTSITQSYNAATETLTLTGSDTVAHYQQVLRTVTFGTASDNPDNFGANPTRTVQWQADDGSAANNLSTIQSTTLNITAVNDAPVLTGIAAQAVFAAHGNPVTLSPGAVVSDVDNQMLASA